MGIEDKVEKWLVKWDKKVVVVKIKIKKVVGDKIIFIM